MKPASFTQSASSQPARSLSAIAVLGVVALVGCSSPAAGGSNPGRGGNTPNVVLTFATIDSIGHGGESEFINAVKDVSGGRLTLKVESEYGDAAPGAESELVQAVAAGSLDGGVAATRAYAKARIHGLQAVEAPLLLDSDRAVSEVVNGPVGRDLLAGLEDDGLHGLALMHGGLRRPVSADTPLLGPEDWKDVRFRVYNSPVQSATIKALGGRPVDASYQWVDRVRANELDGGEFALQGLVDFNLGDGLDFVTVNVVLWPKVDTLIINKKRWEGLTDQQRAWLATAAERAKGANDGVDRDESDAAAKVCAAGVRLPSASRVQLAGIETAAQTVRRALAADAAEAGLLQALEPIAERHKGPSVPTIPQGCEAPRSTTGSGTTSTQGVIPDGTYRMSVTQEELTEAGLSNGPGFSGTWTMKVAGGAYELTCAPTTNPGKDCGNFTGPADTVLERGPLLEVPGGVQLAFDRDPAQRNCSGCPPSQGYIVGWALAADVLTLKHAAQDAAESPQWTFHPWSKIA